MDRVRVAFMYSLTPKRRHLVGKRNAGGLRILPLTRMYLRPSIVRRKNKQMRQNLSRMNLMYVEKYASRTDPTTGATETGETGCY